MSDFVTAIIGAGPAGLTAAYQLQKQGQAVIVFEADPEKVGGIAKTVEHNGFRFDIGGHRFFSKSREIEELWSEILPDDMLVRQRSSRIFYRNRFFSYPLKGGEALLKLGIVESGRCMLSYLRARLFPIASPKTFEDWVSNKFGHRLFQIFFKTYTEKVWGMPCSEISADWAAQRIKGLSLTSAILAAVLPQRTPKEGSAVVKTLIGAFRYPRLGPGMLWERCAERVLEMGGEIRMGYKVKQCEYDSKKRQWTIAAVSTTQAGESHVTANHVISSAPIRSLIPMLRPAVSSAVIDHATQLSYRDFITVAVMLKDRGLFDDQWIYIHDGSVQVGRVQNFKAWSPEMVPDPELTCYGLEYFCFARDEGLWSQSDDELKALAVRELEALHLAAPEDIVDTYVVRQKKAYPIYDEHYADHVAAVRAELESRFPSLHLVGRNGMHKYNNQDHSMMTAMLCVNNIIANEAIYDLWQVNEDAEYHETGETDGSTSGLRQTPRRVKPIG